MEKSTYTGSKKKPANDSARVDAEDDASEYLRISIMHMAWRPIGANGDRIISDPDVKKLIIDKSREAAKRICVAPSIACTGNV